MNFIRSYDYDALPYIDKEYENPAVRDVVHDLLLKEMRSFTPLNYLSYLPYPQPRPSCSKLIQQEILRAESKQPSEKLDMTRYIVTKPEGVLEKDIQAWRKAVSNAKVQYEHLTNQQMNMEVMEQHTASIWLHHNTALEGMEMSLQQNLVNVRREIDDVNLKRKSAQELLYPKLDKINRKSYETRIKCIQLSEKIKDMERSAKRSRVMP